MAKNSMNYDLAQELKNASFPGSEEWMLYEGADGESVLKGGSLPTLSELIEACGKRFGRLEVLHDQNRWLASAPWVKKGGYDADGVTPEEAVAELWLALHKL